MNHNHKNIIRFLTDGDSEVEAMVPDSSILGKGRKTLIILSNEDGILQLTYKKVSHNFYDPSVENKLTQRAIFLVNVGEGIKIGKEYSFEKTIGLK